MRGIRFIHISGGKAIATQLERIANTLDRFLLEAYNVRMTAAPERRGAEPPSVAYDDDTETLKRELVAADRAARGEPEPEEE